MKESAIFLLGTLEMGGSEMKFVRLANAIARSGRSVALAWLGGPETLLSEIDARVTLLPLRRQGKYSLRALGHLGRCLHRNRCTSLVNVNFYPMLYGWPAKTLWRSRARLIASINTTDLIGTREARYMRGYASLLRRMDTVVFGAKAQERQWRNRFKLGSTSTTVIYNGVDTDWFRDRFGDLRRQMRAELGLSEEDRVVICVAQLRPEKGHDVLLKAFSRCETPGARLVLVGDGPLKQELARLAEEIGVSDRLHFAGQAGDVRPWLAAADLFVLASVSVETFSNAALEAAALGRAVVLTDIGGARELMDVGVTGEIVQPGDAEGLARVMDSLLQNDSRRAAMGNAGRIRTEQSFGFGAMQAAWESLLWHTP